MDLFTIVAQSVNAFLHFYITMFFFSTFWSFRFNKLQRFLAVTAMTVMLTCALLFLGNGLLRFAAVLILTFALTLIYEAKWIQRGIYMAIGYSVESIIELVVGVLLQVLFNMNYDGDASTSIFIIGMLGSKLVGFLVFMFIRITKKESLFSTNKKYPPSIFLFPLCTLLIMIMATIYWLSLGSIPPAVVYLTLLICVVLLPANMIIFDYIDSVNKNAVSEAKLALANEIIAAQIKQYEAIIGHNKDIMKIRHDQKHFCIGLLSDLRSGKVDEAIDQLTAEFDICNEASIYQDNAVLTLIDIKKKSVEGENIDIAFEYHSLNKIKINSTDIAVAIGNAIDNAIEACRRIGGDGKKTVNVAINVKDDKILIRVINPTHKNVNVDELETSKENSDAHGIGIISIKQIAKKYGGEVILSCHNNVFNAVIMLKNS